MLYNDVNEFNWSVDNFGNDYNSNAFGAAVQTGAANTKGSAVSLIAGASVTEDIYGIAVQIGGGETASARRSFLVDILIDEAGGTSWSVKIPNLLAHQSNMGMGNQFYFPLYVKAGSSIGAQAQCNAATISPRVGVKLFGKPTRPDLLKVGHTVEAIGVDTVNTLGTSVTSGANAWSAWTSLSASSQDNWWWQVGLTCTDTTMATNSGLVMFELSAGDETNKKDCLVGCGGITNAGENLYKPAFGLHVPIMKIPSGETVYGRHYSNSTADTGWYMAAYGVR